MRIEISPSLQPKDEASRQSIEQSINRIILSAIEIVQAESDNIEAIILVEGDKFNATVNQLQQDAGLLPSCTNNEIHVAVGKTLVIRSDEQILNTIVFRDNFMGAILQDNMEFEALPIHGDDAQYCFYLLAHEVGHTKDNTLRSISGSNEAELKRPFHIDDVAKYYGPILVSELAACVHSAAAMTPKVYAQETKDWHDVVIEYVARTKKSWQKYQKDNTLLEDLAFDAAQAFWVIVVQYSKLIGFRIGNPSLPESEENFNSEVSLAIKEAESTLRQIWERYPNWTETTADPLLGHWQTLASAYGYRFVRSEPHDALYLDRSKIERS